MEIVRVLAVPKEGNSERQYEDAWAVGDDRVAVGDGASEAIYARDWAELLVSDCACGDPMPDSDAAFWSRVDGLGLRWEAQREGETGARAWYAQEKLPEGSAASLLVVRIAPPFWQGWSVGDACCFVVAQNRLRYAFPLTGSRAFGNRPPLVRSREGSRRPPVVRTREPLPDGARIFVGTDAISRWFLAEFERGRKPWDALPSDDASTWVAERRADGSLHDDDVTLLELAS